jgi:hypothetical protein
MLPFSLMRRDPVTMARPRATRNPAQKNRGPSRPNLSGFGLSRKPLICPGLLGCFLFPEKGLLNTTVEAVVDAHFVLRHGERSIESGHGGKLRV